MDLSDLRIFSAVVREGGVTRAARRLHRVQSNVTTRIRKLEHELGVRLFIREGKRSTWPAGARCMRLPSRMKSRTPSSSSSLRTRVVTFD